MKLYYAPRTRSTRPRWLLEELGVPYELVRVDLAQGAHKQPDYLQHVHPLGLVPALEDGGQVFMESTAHLLHLADRFPRKGLAPEPGSPERAAYYQWMAFAMTTLEPPLEAFLEHTQSLPEAQRVPALAERAVQRFTDAARVLDARLEGREFVAGSRFSAADVLVASILAWAGSLGRTKDFPGLQAYARRQLARPAAQRARAD
ncbi:glutathione S-transferase family protein [Corallococcus sp. Z5C101001]|uniref:glutathione S-transferase family protein n=1 Tax=Corallococcus sp. Z5C101001 TaxID=2596829 RepID=UPI00117EE36C|nr:glutathione S-transferase family protein [Corallococcus sp. Z5C101001]TSC27669.1 glutathione S-transferase family protein [Corallococcus sp. Z5C101001]